MRPNLTLFIWAVTQSCWLSSARVFIATNEVGAADSTALRAAALSATSRGTSHGEASGSASNLLQPSKKANEVSSSQIGHAITRKSPSQLAPETRKESTDGILAPNEAVLAEIAEEQDAEAEADRTEEEGSCLTGFFAGLRLKLGPAHSGSGGAGSLTGGSSHTRCMMLGRFCSISTIATLPLIVLAVGGLLSKRRGPAIKLAILVLLLVIRCMFYAAPILGGKGLLATVFVSCLLFWGGLRAGIGSPQRGRHRGSKKKKDELNSVWEAFFDACRDRGVKEIQQGRLSREEVEGVEPRLLLALPSLVILQCALNSIGKDHMELPGGTKVDESHMLGEGRREGTFRIFSLLAAIHRELRQLTPMTESERLYLEARALQDCPQPFADSVRAAEVNRVAASVAAAATELSQLKVFRRRMRTTLEQISAALLRIRTWGCGLNKK